MPDDEARRFEVELPPAGAGAEVIGSDDLGDALEGLLQLLDQGLLDHFSTCGRRPDAVIKIVAEVQIRRAVMITDARARSIVVQRRQSRRRSWIAAVLAVTGLAFGEKRRAPGGGGVPSIAVAVA